MRSPDRQITVQAQGEVRISYEKNKKLFGEGSSRKTIQDRLNITMETTSGYAETEPQQAKKRVTLTAESAESWKVF